MKYVPCNVVRVSLRSRRYVAVHVVQRRAGSTSVPTPTTRPASVEAAERVRLDLGLDRGRRHVEPSAPRALLEPAPAGCEPTSSHVPPDCQERVSICSRADHRRGRRRAVVLKRRRVRPRPRRRRRTAESRCRASETGASCSRDRRTSTAPKSHDRVGGLRDVTGPASTRTSEPSPPYLTSRPRPRTVSSPQAECAARHEQSRPAGPRSSADSQVHAFSNPSNLRLTTRNVDVGRRRRSGRPAPHGSSRLIITVQTGFLPTASLQMRAHGALDQLVERVVVVELGALGARRAPGRSRPRARPRGRRASSGCRAGRSPRPRRRRAGGRARR